MDELIVALTPVLAGISCLTIAQVASCVFTFIKNLKQMQELRKEVRDNTKECEMAQKVLDENAELKKQLTHVMSKLDKIDYEHSEEALKEVIKNDK